MLATRTSLAQALSVSIVLSCTAVAAPLVRPAGMWGGKVRDKSHRNLAPQSGFIADAATWKKVWTAWRPGDRLPKVDFDNELILVGTVPGPNIVILRPTVDGSGNLRFQVAGTKIGGPGFGYKFIRVSRKGVKSVNGKPVGRKRAGKDSITVKVVGKLRTGIVAIGGETTGTTITANRITWELDLSKTPAFQKTAKMLNGKRAVVTGSLERRKGVERKVRWIVTVTSLKPAGT